MDINQPETRPTSKGSSTPGDVETYLAAQEDPLRQELQAIREIILGADPAIQEGIKWNVPSFRTTEWFATFNLRGKDGIQVILHLGAKVRDNSTVGMDIPDPQGLLEWLAKERALVKFRDLDDIENKRTAFSELIRQWIRHV